MSVFEVAGTWASGDKDTKGIWVRASEVGQTRITIDPLYTTAYLTVEEARSLARQLYRLARRVEKRATGE